ncbi:MAG: hypothetical protein WD398_05440 [Cyclobacteriaceae bacterium]
MQNISKFFDKLLINNDEDNYREFRVDQIPFGHAANNLHSFLPAHAVLREGKIKVGSQNWGRGIGWYFYTMAEYSKYVEEEPFFDIISGIISSMEILKMDGGIWSQFPGTSDRFDASTTVMYMYAKNLIFPVTYTKQEVLSLFSPYLYKGIVGHTSGGVIPETFDSLDTVGQKFSAYGFNAYIVAVIRYGIPDIFPRSKQRFFPF